MRRGSPPVTVDSAVPTAGAPPGNRMCPFQVRVAGVRGPGIGTVPATRVSPAPCGTGSLTQPSARSPDPAQNTKEVMTSQSIRRPARHQAHTGVFTAHPGPLVQSGQTAQAHPRHIPVGGLARLRVEKAPGLGIAGDYLTEQPADLLAEKKKRRTGKDRNVMAIFTPRHRSPAPEHARTADAPRRRPPGTGHNSRSPSRCPMTHIPRDRTGPSTALIRASLSPAGAALGVAPGPRPLEPGHTPWAA